MTDTAQPEWFSDDELRALLVAFAEGTPEFTEEDFTVFVDWAADARLSGALLEMCLEGKLKVSWRDDVNDWGFALSAHGKELAEALAGR